MVDTQGAYKDSDTKLIPKQLKKSRKNQAPIDIGDAGEESLGDQNTVTSTNTRIKPRNYNKDGPNQFYPDNDANVQDSSRIDTNRYNADQTLLRGEQIP